IGTTATAVPATLAAAGQPGTLAASAGLDRRALAALFSAPARLRQNLGIPPSQVKERYVKPIRLF
ncbi:hypothetical protein, partial [Pseudomonas sp. Pseusp97]|uniref:hypothetical protein n=1 Tax=Pseudomonas sp. Pseusp97 TaxID=3243065 RepID=UPI0039A5C16B